MAIKCLLVFEPGVDGVFRHVEGLTRFLVDCGHQVGLAYSSKRGSAALRTLVWEATERGDVAFDMNVDNAPCLGDPRALFRICQAVIRWSPDVIHAHSSKAGALGRVAGRILCVPTFYTAHAYYGMGKISRAAKLVFDSVERVLGPLGKTINISADEAAFACDVLGIAASQQSIIPNPTDPFLFTPATSEERILARRQLGIPEGAVAIGSIGRLTHQKDPATLYRAFAQASRKHSSLLLVHVGEGALDQELKQLAEELGITSRIKRLPYQDEPRRFYWAIDALVMSSTYEAGWPIVILEAMACGLPVAATTAPGMSDIGFAGLSHCWTAAVGNYVALGGAIESLLEDMPNRRQSNHRETIEDRFTPEICFGKVLEHYKAIIANHQKK